MSKKILDYHPELDGFQFPNYWEIIQEDRDYLLQELEGPANKAILTLGLSVHLIPIAGGIVEALVGGLSGLGPLALPVGLYIAIAAGAGREIVKAIVSNFKEAGMCGGWVQAAMDYWNKQWIIPGLEYVPGNPDPNRPASKEDLLLRTYIRERLADTLRAHLAQFLAAWVDVKLNLQYAPKMPFLGRLEKEYREIKRRLDNNELVTIGIIGSSPSPVNMHQVLCYGYEEFHGGKWSTQLFINDPNAPKEAKVIKLSLWKSNGQWSEIWTDITTSQWSEKHKQYLGISPGLPNWLGCLFAVDYTAKTPKPVLSASPLRISSSDQVNRLRRDILVDVETDLKYQGAGVSLELIPCLRQTLASGKVYELEDASRNLKIASGKADTATWQLHLPGDPGKRKLELLAHRIVKDSTGKILYEGYRHLLDQAGKAVSATAELRDRPQAATISWNFDGDIPKHGGGSTLVYPLKLSVSDSLGAGSQYHWTVTGVNAKSMIYGSGQTTQAQAEVDATTSAPSKLRVDVEGIDNGFNESVGSIQISLPRAHAWMEVLRSKSVAYGAPRLRNPSGPGWIGQKAVLMQAYSLVCVRLSWANLAGGAPTRVKWVLSDSRHLFTPAPPADLSKGYLDIHVSTVGCNDPSQPSVVPFHDPKPVILSCTIYDAAGQKVDIHRQVEAWYPAGFFVPGTAFPLEPEQVHENLVQILPEVRERLLSGLPADISNELREKVGGYTEFLFEELADIQIGDFYSLASEIHPNLTPEDPIFEELPIDTLALRFKAPDRVLLTKEASLEYDMIEKTSLQVIEEYATIGKIEMVNEPVISVEREFSGGELLADLGFMSR